MGSLFSPCEPCFLGTPDFSPACLFFFRENPAPCQFFLCVLRALCVSFFKTCQLKSWRSQAYRAVARRKSAYATITVWDYRGVTNGTPRSPFCFLYAAMMSGYRAVAKRRSAYAAMPVWGYRGVASRTPRSAFYSCDPTWERLGTPGNSGL